MPLRHSSSEHVRAAAKFSHPAIFWAAAEFGDLSQSSYDRVKVRWKMVLDEAYRRCYDVGGKFATVPEPAPLLTHQPSKLTPEQHQAYIDKLKQELGVIQKPMPSAQQTEQQRQEALTKLDKALAERSEEDTP